MCQVALRLKPLKNEHADEMLAGQHELSVEDSDFNYPFRQRR